MKQYGNPTINQSLPDETGCGPAGIRVESHVRARVLVPSPYYTTTAEQHIVMLTKYKAAKNIITDTVYQLKERLMQCES